MRLTVNRPRKDGKYPTTYRFEGGPNGFGGTFPGRTINKLHTKEQAIAAITAAEKHDLDTVINYSGLSPEVEA